MWSELERRIGGGVDDQHAVYLSDRQLTLVEGASVHLCGARSCLADNNFDLLAEELKLARQCLDELVGVKTNEALLGDIFSSFCLGK